MATAFASIAYVHSVTDRSLRYLNHVAEVSHRSIAVTDEARGTESLIMVVLKMATAVHDFYANHDLRWPCPFWKETKDEDATTAQFHSRPAPDKISHGEQHKRKRKRTKAS